MVVVVVAVAVVVAVVVGVVEVRAALVATPEGSSEHKSGHSPPPENSAQCLDRSCISWRA